MLNELKITLDPYYEINTATLNGNPLSPYSELSNYLKEPFLRWAYKLMDAAEQEINDDYRLVLVGERFETMLLQDVQTDNDACKDYSTAYFPMNLSPTDRFNMVADIARNNRISLPAGLFQVPVSLDSGFKSNNQLLRIAPLDQAFLCITEDPEKAKEAVRNRTPLIVCLSSRNAVSMPGGCCLWEVERERFRSAARAAIDRFVTVPAVVKAAKMILDTKGISPEDLEKSKLAVTIDLHIQIPDIPPIEAGDSFVIQPRIFPPGSKMPEIRLRSSNPSVLAVDGLRLHALAPGNVILEFYRDGGILPFLRRKAVVSSDNYVRRIELSAPETYVRVGMVQQIEALLLPEGADDVQTLKWETSDNRIGEIDPGGVFKANRVGAVFVKASTQHTEQSLKIEVLPDAQGIHSSENRVDLYVGETYPITAEVYPKDCYDGRYYWSSSNPQIANVIELADGSTVVRAVCFGDCVLTCSTADGSFSDTCSVHVESTFRKKKKSRAFLAGSFAAMVFAFLCLMIALPTGAMVGAAVAVLLGILAIQKNKNDIVWSALIIIASTVIAFAVRSGWFQ